MANTWAGLNVQLGKIESALGKLTPPAPDDQFEALRQDALKFLSKCKTHITDRTMVDAGEDDE